MILHKFTQRAYQATLCCCPADLLVRLYYLRTIDGGVGLHRGPGPTELEGQPHLHHLPALRLPVRWALSHHPWLQAQAKAAPAGRALA